MRLRVSLLAMKQLNNPHRAALTAIAAVLVLGSTPALAQQLPAGSDAGVQAPVAAAPAVPAAAPEIVIPNAQSAPAPLVSTNNGVTPITVAPPVAQPAPTVSAAPIIAEKSAPTPQVAEENPAPRAASAAPAEPATPTVAARAPTPQAAPTTAPAQAATEPMPGIAPSELMAMEQGEAAATVPPVEQTPAANADDSNMLAIVGGTGAVLLLGGAAYALSRRRKIVSQDAVTASYEPQSARVTDAPISPAAREAVMPVATMAAPVQPMVRSSETAPVVSSDLEAVAAAAPTAANPFLTRRNRLRRAHFLLHREQGANTASMHEAAKAPEVATTNQSQSQRSAQPVYSFGKAPVTYRPAGWKPSTT